MRNTIPDSKACRNKKGTSRKMRRWRDGRFRMRREDAGWREMGG